MQLTPHRAELVLEALQLREFGYTQQQIADTLSTPADAADAAYAADATRLKTLAKCADIARQYYPVAPKLKDK